MSPRPVKEWIGLASDSAVPPRVRLRVWEKAAGYCASCRRKILAGERWECDHIRALVNDGKHSENNLQVLCTWCHKRKTADDVAVKSYNYERRLAHAGIKRRKSRPMPGGRNSPFKKKVSGEVIARRLYVKW